MRLFAFPVGRRQVSSRERREAIGQAHTIKHGPLFRIQLPLQAHYRRLETGIRIRATLTLGIVSQTIPVRIRMRVRIVIGTHVL